MYSDKEISEILGMANYLSISEHLIIAIDELHLRYPQAMFEHMSN